MEGTHKSDTGGKQDDHQKHHDFVVLHITGGRQLGTTKPCSLSPKKRVRSEIVGDWIDDDGDDDGVYGDEGGSQIAHSDTSEDRPFKRSRMDDYLLHLEPVVPSDDIDVATFTSLTHDATLMAIPDLSRSQPTKSPPSFGFSDEKNQDDPLSRRPMLTTCECWS